MHAACEPAVRVRTRPVDVDRDRFAVSSAKSRRGRRIDGVAARLRAPSSLTRKTTMPGIADQLKSAPIITQQMVRQAMQEVQTDPTQFQKLQECVDQQGAVAKFEDEGQYRQLLQFVLDYGADKFVLTPNTQSAQPRQATITEARITKV